MSVIVHDDMNIDLALKMLWREANREKLFDVVQKNRYRVKPTTERHEFRKKWAKMKRRRKAAKRKLRIKGIGI
jgi:ribosomal protein S21